MAATHSAMVQHPGCSQPVAGRDSSRLCPHPPLPNLHSAVVVASDSTVGNGLG